MKYLIKNNIDVTYAVLLFIFLWVIQTVVLITSFPTGFNFGYEFAKVATSILNGNGYGNPWGGNSGPTAAVLPALVYLHYIAFLFFGKSLTTYILLSILKFAALAITYYYILLSFKLNNIRINYLIYSCLFLLFISFSPTFFFKHTGDLWIYIFLVAWYLYSQSHYFLGNRKKGRINLIIFCLVSPMINPAIALAGLSVFGIYYILFTYQQNKAVNANIFQNFNKAFLGRNFFIHIKTLIIFPIAFSITIFIWSYRNYIIFETFIPTKSNLWMEYYNTNMCDEDGLLSYSTVLLYHPTGNDSVFNEFAKKGEIVLMKEYEALGRLHRKAYRDVYHKKTLNRLINAFVFTKYDLDVAESTSKGSYSQEDKEILINNKLLVSKYWVCLDLSEDEFKTIISSVPLESKEMVYDDWNKARKQYYRKRSSIRTIFRGLMMGIVPTLSMIFLLLFSKSRNNLLILSSVIFYVVYIIPYILFSHQLRYQRPLFVIHLVLIYCLVYYSSNNSRILKINWHE